MAATAPQTMPKPQLPRPVTDITPEIKQARALIARAKVGMMGKGSTFITSVCFSLKHVLSYEVDRAATDGKHIYYNPDWVLKQTKPHLLGVCAHETWHVCLNHCKLMLYSRQGNRNPEIWNIACDCTINNLLHDAGFSLPDPHIFEPKYRGWLTEAIYEDLIKNCTTIQLEPGQGDLIAQSGGTDPGEGVAGDPGEMDPEIQRIIVRATTAARMAGEDPGNLPGELQFQLEQITNPKMPWDRLLVRYCRNLAKTKYNFLVPNRRYWPKHFLPSKRAHSLGIVDAAIDLSYSVEDEQIQQFIAEIASVLRKMRPRKLNLVEFDTSVRNVTALRGPQALLNHTFTGRGGTDIGPVIDHAEESQPDVMLIFTDGEFYHCHESCTVPVVWINFDNPGFTAPFGKVIHFDMNR